MRYRTRARRERWDVFGLVRPLVWITGSQVRSPLQSLHLTAAYLFFARSTLFDVANHRLTAVPNLNSLDANNLRTAVPQAAQRFNQGREGSRQPANSCCRGQDVAVAIGAAKAPKDRHCG